MVPMVLEDLEELETLEELEELNTVLVAGLLVVAAL